MCRVPVRVGGTLSTFTTPQDGDLRPHCRDKADNSQDGARCSPAHRDAGFATTGFATTGLTTTGLTATGLTTTGLTTTGLTTTGLTTTGHLPHRMPTGDITRASYPALSRPPPAPPVGTLGAGGLSPGQLARVMLAGGR